MYSRFDQIEKALNASDHFDGIGYYAACSRVSMTSDDLAPLKEVLIKDKVIDPEDNVELIKVEDPLADLTGLCDEWHIEPDVKKALIDITGSVDGYYKVWADGSYASYGYNWSTCRLFCRGDEFVLVEFYLCD